MLFFRSGIVRFTRAIPKSGDWVSGAYPKLPKTCMLSDWESVGNSARRPTGWVQMGFSEPFPTRAQAKPNPNAGWVSPFSGFVV